MRMRPHVDALAAAKLRRPEMIEEDEWADHAPIDMRQRAADREVADVDAAGHDHEIDGVGGPLVAGRRVFAGKEAHAGLLRTELFAMLRANEAATINPCMHADRVFFVGGDVGWARRLAHSSRGQNRFGAVPTRGAQHGGFANPTVGERGSAKKCVRYFTSSGSVPVGLPAASRVIFSTRASASRSSSSHRRLSASPRS